MKILAKARARLPRVAIVTTKVEEVGAMLTKGAIEKLQLQEAQRGFYSNIFLVPKKGGEMRPVINLKALNQFVEVQHFKMEGMHTFSVSEIG